MISKRRSELRRHKASRSQTPNRWVFNNRLNCPRLSHCRGWTGNMFHRRGPAAAKHRSPKLLLQRRTTHIAVSVDRSRRVLTSEVSRQSSARYTGACPVRHWWNTTAPFPMSWYHLGERPLKYLGEQRSPSTSPLIFPFPNNKLSMNCINRWPWK